MNGGIIFATQVTLLCHILLETGLLISVKNLKNTVTKSRTGPGLRRAMTRLMKLPKHRDAHATDDRLMSALFVPSLVGDLEDEGVSVELGAEEWELVNMCNSQYTLGSWVSFRNTSF